MGVAMRLFPLLVLALAGCSSITLRDGGADASGDANPPADARNDAGRDAAPGPDARDAATTDATVDASPDASPDDVTPPPDAPPADAPPDPCAARPCPSWQRCVPSAAGYNCVLPCDGISCTPPEMCFNSDINGQPLATDAYGAPLGVCLDPCADVTCPANQACVPGAHGAPLGICIDRCDCRNCGNCGSDGTFVGQQAFCGNPSGMPATLECTVPCTGGAGCIPWDAQGGICWPLEGCFSATPDGG